MTPEEQMTVARGAGVTLAPRLLDAVKADPLYPQGTRAFELYRRTLDSIPSA
jgi:hypothetical protein